MAADRYCASKDCPHEECLELLEDQLYMLKCFLGEEGYAAYVQVCFDDLPNVKEAGVSRRDFLRAMVHGGQKATALVLNDVVGSKVDAMIYRRLLPRGFVNWHRSRKAFPVGWHCRG